MSGGAAADGLIGTVLQDSYRVTRLIGRGGMGAVYQGTQLRLNKRVAIKVLARELSSNEEALARFRREAEVTSQLGHPHIVQVNDFGTTPSGEPYLVMEFLEGEDLDQRIRKARRLSLPTTATIIKQIASALSSTHARGIVHRDLKPANVFLMEVEGEADFVKIVDFGISKVRAASLRLTSAYAVMGTPNYMSPEQASGQVEDVDHRTDQWSLACIAYEMLSGRGPFLGDTIHALLYQVVNQQPPQLSSLVLSLPPELEKVIARGMAKAKADRFPTINAFSRAFLAAMSASPVASIAAVPTEVAAATARVRQQAQPAAATPAAESPNPQPTTLSRTASELVTTPLSKLRSGMKSKWTAVAGAALAVAIVLAVVFTRAPRPSTVDTAIKPASAGGATPATVSHAPIVAPIAAPAPAAQPPAVPTPPPSQPPPPTAAAQPTSSVNEGSRSKRSRIKTQPATPTTPPAVTPAAKVPPARPPARHGSIIEEL